MRTNTCKYFLTGNLTDDVLRSFIVFVQNDIPDDCKELEIVISSCGGSVSVGIAIYELLQSLPLRIVTHNLSNVDSAAIVIYAAGEIRTCEESASFFFHSVGKRIDGVKTKDELKEIIKEIDFDTERMVAILERATRRSRSYWRECMEKGSLINSQEATQNGLSNKIQLDHKENR